MRTVLLLILAILCPLSSLGQQETMMCIALKGLDKGDTLILQLPAYTVDKHVNSAETKIAGPHAAFTLLIHETQPVALRLNGYEGEYIFTAIPGDNLILSGKVRKQNGNPRMVSFHRMHIKAKKHRHKGNSAAQQKHQHERLSAITLTQNATSAMAPSVELSDTSSTTLLFAPANIGARLMLIDFWASWCEPCRREIPFLRQLHEEYVNQGLQIVSISIDRHAADWHEALRELRLPWTSYLDTSQQAIHAYDVRYIPSTFLIDNRGRIIASKLRGEELSATIKRLLE